LCRRRHNVDHGLTGTTRARPGLEQARAAVRAGDTLIVAKLDRLARSVPDARTIGDDLAARDIKLSLGGHVYDPADPMGKMFFTILAGCGPGRQDLNCGPLTPRIAQPICSALDLCRDPDPLGWSTSKVNRIALEDIHRAC
jgi:Resolvase, N terminal domain